MKVMCRLLGVFAAALAFVIAGPQRLAAQGGDVTVIEGGTLIDGTGRAPVPNAVIVVEGNRIQAAGAKGSVQEPAGAKKIDATGKWILPGLIESHGHYREYVPELLINHGITTDIDTGNWMDYVLAVREANNSDKNWGPRVFTTGAGITGAGAGDDRDRMVVHNAAEAKAAAEEHVRRKVDFIKVYAGVTSEELKAITDVAHKAGIVVVGHLGITDAREAALSGIDGLVHGSGISGALLPPAEAKASKEPASAENPWGYTGAGGVWHYKMDESRFDELIQLFVSRHVMIEPDVVHTFKNLLKQWDQFDLEIRHLFDNPNLSYVPVEATKRFFGGILRGATPEFVEQNRVGYQKLTRFLKKFVDAGGVLLAGSDFVGAGTPGATLQQELQVYVEEVGLTPMQAIQTATRNAADFYLKGKNLGTLEPGKLADLIIIKDDPLKDIRNTRKIELVMKGGRIMELGYHAWFFNPYHHPGSDAPGVAQGLSVSPYVVTRGDHNVVLTVKGEGFGRNSLVWLAGHPLKTTYVSATQLKAEIPDALLQGVGTFQVEIGRIGGAPTMPSSSAPTTVMVKYPE